MKIAIEKLLESVDRCHNLILPGYKTSTSSGNSWLNQICAEFLYFSNDLHGFLHLNKTVQCENNEEVENIFLCLTQILICVKYLEQTLKSEHIEGKDILLSRRHFLDRMAWCTDRIKTILTQLKTDQYESKNELNIVQLIDRALDYLSPYSSYNSCDMTNEAAENNKAMMASKQIRYTIDQFIGHVLAFANVALENDKKAISALCQKVLRECIAFQDECCLDNRNHIKKPNQNERKLKAMSLESALHQIEDYIDGTLLRLVFSTFMNYSKFSIDKLRIVIQLVNPDETQLDELIADFDVNIDRTTQIGIFAIAFTPDTKVRTIVRSCLASFESLDSCIIPALQSNCVAYSEILEQHFNEEVRKFKCAIQEIIDSYAFCESYLEILSDSIAEAEKNFNKTQLVDIIQMGWVLQEHFQLEINYKSISKCANSLDLFNKFTLMLGECQAILMCAEQVEHSRIFKRFKIVRSILRKLLKFLDIDPSKKKKSFTNELLISDSETNQLFDSIGITPAQQSILYQQGETPRRSAREMLKSTYSNLLDEKTATINNTKVIPMKIDINGDPSTRQNNRFLDGHKSVKRKESLRTTLFKRQKSVESEKIYKAYKEDSNSLQITEILNQLTQLSSNISNAITSD